MAKELPGMPKIDKCAETAINYLALRKQRKGLDEKMKDCRDELCKELYDKDCASIRVEHDGEMFTLEADHVETEKIIVKKG